MTKSVRSGRRVAVLASVLAAALALSGCSFLDDVLKGTNPIAKELDKTARKGVTEPPDRSLSIPPGYSLLPPVDAAGRGSAPGAAPGGRSGGANAAGAPASKKIDLGAARGGEAVTRETVVTNRGAVREGNPGKGEQAPSNPPAKKN